VLEFFEVPVSWAEIDVCYCDLSPELRQQIGLILLSGTIWDFPVLVPLGRQLQMVLVLV
jgi:hypothetical protein